MRWDRHVEEQIALLRTELHATDDSSVAGHLAEIEGEYAAEIEGGYADTQRQERARGHRGVTAHGQRLPARNTDSLQSLHVPGLFAAGESGWGAGGVKGPRGPFLGAPSHADAASHAAPDMDPLQEQDASMVHMDAMDGIRAWMGAPARVDPLRSLPQRAATTAEDGRETMGVGGAGKGGETASVVSGVTESSSVRFFVCVCVCVCVCLRP